MATMTMTSPAQRDRALSQANARRRLGRLWKEDMAASSARDGRLAAAEVLLDDPERVGGLTIYAFLVSIPRLGDVKAKQMLMRRDWYIWPFRKVRELTPGQRERIAFELRRLGTQI